jgi:hypothetical protein
MVKVSRGIKAKDNLVMEERHFHKSREGAESPLKLCNYSRSVQELRSRGNPWVVAGGSVTEVPLLVMQGMSFIC